MKTQVLLKFRSLSWDHVHSIDIVFNMMKLLVILFIIDRNKFELNCCTLSPTLNDIENSITFTVRTGVFVTLGRTSQVLQRRGNFNRLLKEPHSIIETGKLVRLLRSINCLRRKYSEGCWCWELGCCFGGLLDAGGISTKWTTFERGCYPFSYNVKLA